MLNTPFADKKLNNPDQPGVLYMALHGVPHTRAVELNQFMAPYRAKRNARNRRMVDAINGMMGKYGITIDFDADVLPLSNYAQRRQRDRAAPLQRAGVSHAGCGRQRRKADRLH